MALEITINITDDEQIVLEHDLLDVDEWVQQAVVGKINNCKKRMAAEAARVLKADASVSTMPADDDGLVAALASRPGYQNRAEREA